MSAEESWFPDTAITRVPRRATGSTIHHSRSLPSCAKSPTAKTVFPLEKFVSAGRTSEFEWRSLATIALRTIGAASTGCCVIEISVSSPASACSYESV